MALPVVSTLTCCVARGLVVWHYLYSTALVMTYDTQAPKLVLKASLSAS